MPETTLSPASLAAIALLVLTSLSAQAQKTAADLPPGTMQPKATTACTECHEARIILQQRLTKPAWAKEVDKMTKWGALVDPADRDALIDYLSINFSPEKPAYEPPRTAAKQRGLANLVGNDESTGISFEIKRAGEIGNVFNTVEERSCRAKQKWLSSRAKRGTLVSPMPPALPVPSPLRQHNRERAGDSAPRQASQNDLGFSPSWSHFTAEKAKRHRPNVQTCRHYGSAAIN